MNYLTVLLVFIQTVSLAQIPASYYKPEVAFVKGGTFQMGNANGQESEQPVHSVTLDDFSIGKYEVTVLQYRRFCDVTKRRMPYIPQWGWDNNHPIVNVKYDDAVAYCNWLKEEYGGNWRLPTEAEWEYAARGGDQSKGYIYSGDNDLNNVGWFGENSGNQPHRVGSKHPNELGIYDMTGNVWEWCSDWFGYYYYANSPSHNPTGPASEAYKVQRGASWGYPASKCYVTIRTIAPPSSPWSSAGFRVVLTE